MKTARRTENTRGAHHDGLQLIRLPVVAEGLPKSNRGKIIFRISEYMKNSVTRNKIFNPSLNTLLIEKYLFTSYSRVK